MAYGFPSPTGDLYFSIVPVLTSHAGLNPFPSPTGDLYFSINTPEDNQRIVEFPSPTGDLYFSMGIPPKATYSIRAFPSPTGDLYFSMVDLYFKATPSDVSVPYRGLIFLNKFLAVSQQLSNGFRPLPGTYISQSHCF